LSSQASQPTLSDLLDPERLLPILLSDENREAVKNLCDEYLPEGQRGEDEMKQQLRSAQFQQTCERMTGILNGRMFSSLLSSLSLEAKGSIGVQAFLDAIEEKVRKEKEKK